MASLPLLSMPERDNGEDDENEEETDRDECLHSLIEAADSVAFHTKSLRKLLRSLHPIVLIRLPHRLPHGEHRGFKLDIDMSEVAIRATSIKIGLEAMEKEVSEHQCSDIRCCAMVRVRDFVVESVRKEFCVFVEEVKALREKLWETQCDDLRRRLFSVTGEIASEEAVKSMLELGGSQGFLSGKSVKGGERGYGEVLKEIEDRRGFVKKTGDRFDTLEDMLLQMLQEMPAVFERHGSDPAMRSDVREAMANFVRVKDEDEDCSEVDGVAGNDRRRHRGYILLLAVLLAFVFIIAPVVILLLLL